uniref:Uncharacterized protein n=1 Tax=Anopheles christyi TaxID=43041 RepID=A0A182KC63_9DIPT
MLLPITRLEMDLKLYRSQHSFRATGGREHLKESFNIWPRSV